MDGVEDWEYVDMVPAEDVASLRDPELVGKVVDVPSWLVTMNISPRTTFSYLVPYSPTTCRQRMVSVLSQGASPKKHFITSQKELLEGRATQKGWPSVQL